MAMALFCYCCCYIVDVVNFVVDAAVAVDAAVVNAIVAVVNMLVVINVAVYVNVIVVRFLGVRTISAPLLDGSSEQCTK